MVNVLYAGSPAHSAEALSALLAAAEGGGFSICGVLTNPPSAKGRHKTPEPTPVAAAAAAAGIPVFSPEHLDAECRAAVASVRPELLVCFAYGRIFGPKFLSLFRYGGINLHPSALPKYRGCTPVQAAILNRDAETAFTIQKICAGIDEGDILAQEAVPLHGSETAGALLHAAAERGAELFKDVILEAARRGGLPAGTPQRGEPSYTKTIGRDDARIDWSRGAADIDAAVRAYFPDPAAWTAEDGVPLKILAGKAYSSADSLPDGAAAAAPGTVCAFDKARGILVRCGDGVYAVTELQRQGRNALPFRDFMNGARGFVGTVLV